MSWSACHLLLVNCKGRVSILPPAACIEANLELLHTKQLSQQETRC